MGPGFRQHDIERVAASKNIRILAVIARLAAFAKASACLGFVASSKPWRRRDRAIRYAAASRLKH
jgi:hypothetical protein